VLCELASVGNLNLVSETSGNEQTSTATPEHVPPPPGTVPFSTTMTAPASGTESPAPILYGDHGMASLPTAPEIGPDAGTFNASKNSALGPGLSSVNFNETSFEQLLGHLARTPFGNPPIPGQEPSDPDTLGFSQPLMQDDGASPWAGAPSGFAYVLPITFDLPSDRKYG
jgi:hypothetical protein